MKKLKQTNNMRSSPSFHVKFFREGDTHALPHPTCRNRKQAHMSIQSCLSLHVSPYAHACLHISILSYTYVEITPKTIFIVDHTMHINVRLCWAESISITIKTHEKLPSNMGGFGRRKHPRDKGHQKRNKRTANK